MSLQTLVDDVILWNLDIIGDIKNHQTLLVVGYRLNFDNRMFQSVRRALSEDSRDHILQAVESIFVFMQEVLQAFQCNHYVGRCAMQQVQQEQLEIVTAVRRTLRAFVAREDKVKSGLKTLGTFERYNNDSGFKLKMERFAGKMTNLCAKARQLDASIQIRSRPGTSSECCQRRPIISQSSDRKHETAPPIRPLVVQPDDDGAMALVRASASPSIQPAQMPLMDQVPINHETN